jgi:deoxycytidine triphosphate deaminase
MVNKPEWPNVFGMAKGREGFLIDKEIRAAIQNGQLVVNGQDSQAKYACYELQIGSDIQQLVLDREPGARNDLYRGKEISSDGSFQIYPGETFKIVAKESLNIPADVCAFAIPVGNLFRLGLNPETTFADPGFAREFFVTVCNYSRHVVKLNVGDPLCRLFFFKLAQRPDHIHDSNPRAVPLAVERIPKPAAAKLRKIGVSAVLDEVLKDVDPPHFQHAFVTGQFIELRRSWAATTVTAMAALLIVLVIFAVYLGTLLKVWWPEVFGHVLAELGLGGATYALLFFIKPFRRAALEAVVILRAAGPAP